MLVAAAPVWKCIPFAVLGLASCLLAQAQPAPPSHVFGVIPSNNVVYQKSAPPLTSKQKLHIVVRNAYDPLGLASGVAKVLIFQRQGGDQGYCGYGPGWGGFGKCYAAALVDDNTSNFIGSYALASWFHQDPRYFRSGEGGVGARVVYALRRLVVTRSDRGGSVFNSSQLLGTFSSAALSNLYYPHSQRGLGPSLGRAGIDLASSAAFNLAAEFWPDIRHHLGH